MTGGTEEEVSMSGAALRLWNNWAHDVGTGLWAACLLVIWVLSGRAAEAQSGPEFVTAIADVLGTILWMQLASLLVIGATGAIRLTYWRAHTSPEDLAAKRPALVWKHVVLLVVYGGGSWWAWAMVDSAARV